MFFSGGYCVIASNQSRIRAVPEYKDKFEPFLSAFLEWTRVRRSLEDTWDSGSDPGLILVFQKDIRTKNS